MLNVGSDLNVHVSPEEDVLVKIPVNKVSIGKSLNLTL